MQCDGELPLLMLLVGRQPINCSQVLTKKHHPGAQLSDSFCYLLHRLMLLTRLMWVFLRSLTGLGMPLMMAT